MLDSQNIVPIKMRDLVTHSIRYLLSNDRASASVYHWMAKY